MNSVKALTLGSAQTDNEWTLRARVQFRQIQIPTAIPRVGADLSAACRQVGIVGLRPIIGADCRPVAITELRNEDAALLLIASEKVHLKLQRERSGVHEINQSREQHGEYHHIFPQLNADGERFYIYIYIYIYIYFRMDSEHSLTTQITVVHTCTA